MKKILLPTNFTTPRAVDALSNSVQYNFNAIVIALADKYSIPMALINSPEDIKSDTYGIGTAPSRYFDTLNQITNEVGINKPRRLKLNELKSEIAKNGTLICKNPYQHRGEGVYLVESVDELLKLLAWKLNTHRLAGQKSYGTDDNLPQVTSIRNAKIVLDELIKEVNGILDTGSANSEYAQHIIDSLVFEEYIPSGITTRILVDAFGEIQYVLMLKNIPHEIDHTIKYPQIDPETDPWWGYLGTWDYPFHLPIDIPRLHPLSPVKCCTKIITSNKASGGMSIPIYSLVDHIDISYEQQAVVSQTNLMVNSIQGLPISQLKQIALLCSKYALFSGIDLIFDNGEWKFLEVNLMPSITSDLLVPPDFTIEDLDLELDDSLLQLVKSSPPHLATLYLYDIVFKKISTEC